MQATVAPMAVRERLLDAAAEVFCEKGWEGTTVAEVARRAGLTTGAIYANFRDKADLLVEAIVRESADLVEVMNAARNAGMTAAERLLLMARRIISEGDRQGQLLFVELFSAARRDPAAGARVAEALTAMEAELSRLVLRAQEDGDVHRAWDPALLARFCLCLGVGFDHLAVSGLKPPDPSGWAELTSHLLAAVRDPPRIGTATAPSEPSGHGRRAHH
jgi:TetR/AcrR family transcriptional repressor of uid operon